MAIKMYINADELAKVNDVYTKAQTDTLLNSKADTSDLADKQDVLVSGTNIKTINNESLLGSGNISISSGSSDYDTLTDKPIVNQDLDALDFIPVSNTYYRHIGASATTYTIGAIYYYDGVSFKIIDGSIGNVVAGNIDSESATNGQVLMADGSGGASWQNAGGSSDVIIDIGTFNISTSGLNIYNYLSSDTRTQIEDTSVNNVYIKVKNGIFHDTILLKRTKYKIIDPTDNPNQENTEVCFVGSIISDDYNKYNERYVLYYVVDYSSYPSVSGSALLYYTQLGTINEISASNSVIPMGSTLPFSSDFEYDYGNGYIKLATSDYVVSGTIADGDTIQDANAINTLTARKPIIINGKRFEYQEQVSNDMMYLNASLNGTLIHITILKFNNISNIVNFIEQDVNDGMTYTTTIPTAPNTNGLMKLAVLSSDPATKYAGWLYYITSV